MCHTNLQQDISRASFSHQIECVLFCVSFSYEFLVRVSRASVIGFTVTVKCTYPFKFAELSEKF